MFFEPKTKSDVKVRAELVQEHSEVEQVVREAFWNLYVPGANEHFILHNLRQHPDFIKELCLVAVKDDKIIGNIVYSMSHIQSEDGHKHQVITFGPLSVLPEMQGKKVGEKLVNASIEIAKKMGFKAIVILGYPSYYEKFGFKNGKHFGISMPDNSYPLGLQVLQLGDGVLNGVSGKYFESDVFEPDQIDVDTFDEKFSEKKKYVTASQKAFSHMLTLSYGDEIPDKLYELANCKKELEPNDKEKEPETFFADLASKPGAIGAKV